MTPAGPSSSDSSQEKFERDGVVRYDLSSPPADAQQLGARPGQTSEAFNREGDQFWDYEIVLPGGQLFRTRGFGHVATVEPAPFGLADKVLINSRLADIATARAELEAAAPLLGLDLSKIGDWAARAEQSPLTPRNPGDTQVFVGAQLDYLAVDVEARRSRGTDEVTLNWTFGWDSEQTGPPTPKPSPSAAT